MKAFIALYNKKRFKKWWSAYWCQLLQWVSQPIFKSWDQSLTHCQLKEKPGTFRKHPAMSPQIYAMNIPLPCFPNWTLFPKGTCSPNGHTCTRVTTQWRKGNTRIFWRLSNARSDLTEIPQNPKCLMKETMLNKILIQGHLTVGPIGPWTHSVVISLAPE